MARGEVYTNDVRDHTVRFWESYQFLRSLQDEWNAQDYSNTLVVGSGNDDIVAADVGSVVFATMDAIKTVMDSGHATNITTILR